MTSLYFDYNATTPLSVKAQLAIKDAMSIFANPSSHYSLSGMAKKLLTDARRSMASLMGTVPEQILFTSGGTESNNQALSSLLATLPVRICPPIMLLALPSSIRLFWRRYSGISNAGFS